MDERHLDIQLREFRLAICPQVLVTKTASKLVVPFKAGHHQQLLEQLRRLGQRKKLSGINSTGYQVVPRALRGRTGEHRCLYFNEILQFQTMA